MTATTTRDPVAGGGYLPKAVTVLLPPLTVRSAADGEEQRSERELDPTQRVGDQQWAIGGLTCALAVG
jgi:hypothetical protein